MRVLDIGSGMGDVAIIAAELVGPTGSVVSIDIDQASVRDGPKTRLIGRARKYDILSNGYSKLCGLETL